MFVETLIAEIFGLREWQKRKADMHKMQCL